MQAFDHIYPFLSHRLTTYSIAKHTWMEEEHC